MNPQECIVLEDSASAIAAADKAGFSCIGIGESALEHTIVHLRSVAELDFSMIP